MWQNLKTAFLLALLDGLFLLVGGLIGRTSGLIIAAVVALGVNAFAYWNSDRLAIAAVRGQEVSPAQFPELHRIVDDLCAAAPMPKPRVYICDDPSPNAFATGRNPSTPRSAAPPGSSTWSPSVSSVACSATSSAT